jgi:heat shock protein HslJ
MPPRSTVLVALLLLSACALVSPAGRASTQALPSAITDRDWHLVALGERGDPLGPGGRAPTLRLDAASAQANGFGGCNQYGGSYDLSPGSLRFGPLRSTKMACEEDGELEHAFFAMLEATTGYAIEGSELVLTASGAPLARFRSP